MLTTLHQIVREVNAARDFNQALNIIVQRVGESTNVDVCSVYLVDQETSEYVLMATRGLNPGAVGRVRLQPGEGLVGLVGERAEPINLDNAGNHPRFRYFPETDEELFQSFLGIPIIHFRKLLGVLVVQQQAPRRFGDAEVAFLVTVAAQLAGAIAHGEAHGSIDGLRAGITARGGAMVGFAGSPGIAEATAMVVYSSRDLNAVPDRPVEDVEHEIELFSASVRAVRAEFQEISERLANTVSSEERQLFDAYLRMLESDSLIEGVLDRIREGNWAQGALRATIADYVRAFNEMEDPYLRERASDVRDIGRRILMRLMLDSGDEREIPERVILVGQEVSASQLAEIPHERLAGVVSARGSGNSHVAILARAFGVPAVMGVSELPVGRLEGKLVIVDGYSGRVYVNPTEAIQREYGRLIDDEVALKAELARLRDLTAETLDGVRIELRANTGLLSDIDSSLRSGCDGIGLHRTEFPFMVRDRFPGEEEQAELYRQVLEPFKGRPVVLRTLDVGGDKSLPYFPISEDNPFLGWRGVRLTLDHPEIFLGQLRAMLRADIGLHNLQIMFPMISRVDEVDHAISLLQRAHDELIAEGYPVAMPPVGVMIEVPAALFQLEALARRVDFFSVGTNDLTQYLLAVDRNNARVATLYDELHPAVLLALRNIAEVGRREGKSVCVCGSMVSDPAAVIPLLGMGIRALSTSAASLPRLKWVIRSVTSEHAAALLERALALETPLEIRTMLNEELDRLGLGGLVRAGR